MQAYAASILTIIGLSAIKEWAPENSKNNFVAALVYTSTTASAFLKSPYSPILFPLAALFAQWRAPMKIIDLRNELIGLLNAARGLTYGALIEEPKSKKLEPIYFAASYIVTTYLILKIPILLLISYSSQWGFYPYDFIEHWSSSGFGIAFSIILVIVFGTVACLAAAPALIAERQKFLGRKSATPYFIWAVIFIPSTYLHLKTPGSSIEGFIMFMMTCTMFTMQITAILYQPSFKRARNGFLAFVFVAIFAVYAPEIPASFTSQVLSKMGIGGGLTVRIKQKEETAAILFAKIEPKPEIVAKLILLGPTTIYIQDESNGIRMIERTNTEIINLQNTHKISTN